MAITSPPQRRAAGWPVRARPGPLLRAIHLRPLGVVKHMMLDGSGRAAATELQAGSWMICSRDSCHAPNLDHGDHRDNNYQAVGMSICRQRADIREKQRRQAGIRDEYHIVAGQQQGDSLPPRIAKAGYQVHRVRRLRLADFAACSHRRVVEDGDHGCVVVSKLWRMAVTTTALNKVQVLQSRHGLRRRCSTSDRLLGLSQLFCGLAVSNMIQLVDLGHNGVSRYLLIGFLLTAQLCGCTAYVGGGFSVELIHRDSAKSSFHDPSLTAHGRVLAAARRSTARAAALTRSYTGGSPDGAVSEMVSRPFEYLMYVNVGTPPTRMLAVAETGGDIVWLRCANGPAADQPQAPVPDGDKPPVVSLDVSSSATYSRVGCQSGACDALYGTCDASSNCKYLQTFGDGSNITGLLSTETFTFDDAPGGCAGCRERPQLQVAGVNFGCATSINRNFRGSGLVGLGPGKMSLISQIGAATSLGRRFSYCLVPYSNINASSVINFGARAAVTEADAATTPLVDSLVESYYTVALESVKINNSTFTIPPSRSHVIVDSGIPMSYLDKGLLDQMVEELNRTIKLPQKASPASYSYLQPCYDATGTTESILEKMIPDVKLVMAGGAVVTLKARNTFAQVDQSTVCMTVLPAANATDQSPFAILGNIAQQNMHVGYDLDKGTLTFAAADCASAYPSPPVSL